MEPALLIQERLQLKEQPRLQKLHGDASNRVYYRTKISDRSVIVMQLPDGASSISEEISNQPPPTELPFLNMARFLSGRGLPVPQVLHDFHPIILLEDLGNVTLEQQLQSTPTQRLYWYQRAIDLLTTFQQQTHDAGCIAFQRRFDETLLDWEFDHFIEYGIEARQGIKLSAKNRQALRHEMHAITLALTQGPQVLVHRDFQSRNLMVQDDQLRLLDFQDALMGPLPYDLVGLLRDSYISLNNSELNSLIAYFLKQSSSPMDHAAFQKIFDWMTVQRKLKDAGRFVYIDRVKGNPNFLPYVIPSLLYVRQALERQPELNPLFKLLKKYAPELS